MKDFFINIDEEDDYKVPSTGFLEKVSQWVSEIELSSSLGAPETLSTRKAL